MPAGQRPRRSSAETCWRFARKSITAVSRARVRSRIASCRRSGTHTAVSSPARNNFTKLTASRLVGLHPIARLLWDQRWCHHEALVPERFDVPLQLVTGRTGLVAERDPLVVGLELVNQLGDRRRCYCRSPRENEPHPPDRHPQSQPHYATSSYRTPRKLRLCSLDDSPSLLEALPGLSGQPTHTASRVSCPTKEGTYGLRSSARLFARRASRRMAAGTISLVAVLRDARKRAPQDEVEGYDSEPRNLRFRRQMRGRVAAASTLAGG